MTKVEEDRSLAQFFLKRLGKRWAKALSLTAAWAICFILLASNITPLAIKLEVGKPAMRSVVAHRTVLNHQATNVLKAEARKTFLLSSSGNPAYMKINEASYVVAESRLDMLFSLVSQARSASTKSMQVRLDELSVATKAAGVPKIPDAAMRSLLTIDGLLYSDAMSAMKRYVVSVMKGRKILATNLDSERRQVLEGLVQLGLDRGTADAVSPIAEALIEVNASVDIAALEKAADDAEASVQPAYIQKGTLIVKQGQIVTEEQINLTRALGLMKGMEPFWARVSLALLTGFVLFAFSAFTSWLGPVKASDTNRFALSLALITSGVTMSWAAYRFLGTNGQLYVPVAFIVMTLTLMADSGTAMGAGLAAALFNGLMFQGSLISVIPPLAGVLVGIRMARGLSDRFSMVRTALYIAIATLIAAAAVSSLSGDVPDAGIIAASAVNGVLSAVLCLGTMPFAEAALGLCSPFRLLEVSNPGNELLRRIMMEAPGTYHHSIIVGNMAEAAAGAVGADPLLIRAAAMYHDAGKVRQPEFFVENQVNKVNPHDELPPEVSSGIIIDHVTYGIELARSYRLPAVVIDIIAQHHADSKVWYFYHKAMSKYGSVDDESKYTYPGPKPQSAEAALLMLADICEAKVRSINTTSGEKVRDAIHSVIKERLYAGDLNEAPLTLKDLKLIEDSFVSTLSGVKHERIKYPGQKPEELEKSHGEMNGAGGYE